MSFARPVGQKSPTVFSKAGESKPLWQFLATWAQYGLILE